MPADFSLNYLIEKRLPMPAICYGVAIFPWLELPLNTGLEVSITSADSSKIKRGCLLWLTEKNTI
jgi:hypothetical protein